MVCEGEDWLEGAGLVMEGGGVIWLAEGDELMAGGGGRPGMDLIGGGRRGRSFTLEGLEKMSKVNFIHGTKQEEKLLFKIKQSYSFRFVVTDNGGHAKKKKTSNQNINRNQTQLIFPAFFYQGPCMTGE